MRIEPPLIISKDLLSLVVKAISESIEDVEKALSGG
jgi:acetylornithine/succinyldiaminopimelate/putrescine aminotransferase